MVLRSSLLRCGGLGGKLYDHNFFVKGLMVILGVGLDLEGGLVPAEE